MKKKNLVLASCALFASVLFTNGALAAEDKTADENRAFDFFSVDTNLSGATPTTAPAAAPAIDPNDDKAVDQSIINYYLLSPGAVPTQTTNVESKPATVEPTKATENEFRSFSLIFG
ncbi:hypothetical protein [Brevibacillus dissolubilis]|uniref:hypothetical protein n=1 Tax=Brevibacillus dissolubilis TaxID=1844116 RepID=UPI001116FE34|nr:hypothetical protein [Brevibacillus dissolubilis]